MRTATLSVQSGAVTRTLKSIAEKTGKNYVTLFIRFHKLVNSLGRNPNYKELVKNPKRGRPVNS